MPSMTSWITKALLLAALGFSAAFAQNAPPLIVGAVVSQTGGHADLAEGYYKALLLWQDEINANGGLLGRSVELRILDDRSEATRAGKLYAQLIREKADALIGPYGTAATMTAATEAESARRVIVSGAGWSRAVQKRAPRFVFQASVPYSAYGAAAMQAAKEGGNLTAAILARDDPPSREMAGGARDAALKLGISAGEIIVYDGGTSEFEPQAISAQAAGVQAWIAFGEVRDAAEMIKTLKRLGYAPRFFFARKASDRKLIPLVGQDAEFALGAVEYDPRFATPGNDKFVKAYSARWGSRPGPAAAEGYAAATVLAEGLRHARTTDPEKLRAALASLVTGTVLGEFKVDPATGEQIAMAPALTQILKGRPELVWPAALQTAKPVLPYPAWGERSLLK
jgi:branched-chain amino acid transport system substrate-binding protein